MKAPEGWRVLAVEDLASDEPAALTDGPFGSNLKTSHYTDEGPQVIRLQNIGDGAFKDSPAHISEEHFERLRRHEARAHDVVVAMLGDKLPRACLVPEALGPAIVKADCVRLRVNPELADPRFVVYGLNSDALRSQTVDLVHGVGRPRLGLAKFRKLLFPIPLVAEQQGIVESLDSVFSRLDAVEAGLEQVERNLKRYRASVLRAAVTGRLVSTEADLASHEGRSYRPACDILREMPAPSKPSRYGSRSRAVIPGHPALSVGETRATLPRGWIWAPLVEVAQMESGHTPSRGHPEWWDGEVPWLSIPDARENHGATIFTTTQNTNSDGLSNSAARLLPEGTVCVSRTASLGYVVALGAPMATSQDFVNWIPSQAVSSGWLRTVFLAAQEILARFSKGSVHRTVYFPEWLSMQIAIPPPAEQVRITSEVDRLLSVAYGIDAQAQAQLARVRRLRRAILGWAFEGRLTGQDRQ